METVNYDDLIPALSGNMDMQDVFYIVEGAPMTIEAWIQARKKDGARMERLLKSGDVLKLNNPAQRGLFNTKLQELGVMVRSIAQASGLPMVAEYMVEGVKVLRAQPIEVQEMVKKYRYITPASKIPVPNLRMLTVSVGGESYDVQVADETKHHVLDYNPAVFFIKASPMVVAVLRDYYYSVAANVKSEQHDRLKAFHDEVKEFTRTHYYGNMNYDYQLNRLNAVCQVGQEVRNAALSGGNFTDLIKLMEQPLELMKRAKAYMDDIEAVCPAAMIHKSITNKFREILMGEKGGSRIYIMSHVIREFHYFFNGPTQNVLKAGSDFTKSVTQSYMTYLGHSLEGSDFRSAHDRIMKYLYLGEKRKSFEEETAKYIVAGRMFGVALNNAASAGPLYDDLRHSKVGLSEITEASSMMLLLGGQIGHPLTNNMPRPESKEAMIQLINERKLREMKPKAEVYSVAKPMIRNIMAGTYASEIPMGVWNQLTRKFNHHALNDDSTKSMLRMPLTHGGADLWLKHSLSKLRGDATAKFLLYTMADNYYGFYKAQGGIRMFSTDVAKAEGCVSQLTVFASNLRTLVQMGMGGGVRTVTKQVLDSLLDSAAAHGMDSIDDDLEDYRLSARVVLNVRKKERRLEKEGKIKSIKDIKAKRKDVGIYDAVMTEPIGWIKYLLYFYPFTAVDTNVALRTEQFFLPGMASGVVNTANHNNDKSAKAYKAMEAAVKTWMREQDNFDYGFDAKKHPAALEKLLQSHNFMKEAELKMTVEADVQLTDSKSYDLDAEENEGVGIADILGFDLRLVDPDDGYPSMYIPVLRRRSLLSIILFHKFERKFEGQPESPDLTLTKNLLLVINLKVAYFVGGWAYREMSMWIRQTLRRIFTSYTDLRAVLQRLSEEQLQNQVNESLDYDSQMFADLLGMTLLDVIREPNVSLNLVWRVYGHGKGAVYDDQDRVVSPNLIRRIFKDYVPISEREHMFNMVAVVARAMPSPTDPLYSGKFEMASSLYLSLLDGNDKDVYDVKSLAKGNSFEERMQYATRASIFLDEVEGTRTVPEEINDTGYRPPERPPTGPQIGSTYPHGDLASSGGELIDELRSISKYQSGAFEPARPMSTQTKAGMKKSVTTTLVPEVEGDRLGYVLRWARQLPKMLRAPKPGGPPNPLREKFALYMPKFYNPRTVVPYDNDRHLTKVAIMRLLARAEKENEKSVRKTGEMVYPNLDVTRDEFSFVEKHLESVAGRSKRYAQLLPPMIDEAKLPPETNATVTSFANQVLHSMNAAFSKVMSDYNNANPPTKKNMDSDTIADVVAEGQAVLVHTEAGDQPTPEEPTSSWADVMADEDA